MIRKVSQEAKTPSVEGSKRLSKSFKKELDAAKKVAKANGFNSLAKVSIATLKNRVTYPYRKGEVFPQAVTGQF